MFDAYMSSSFLLGGKILFYVMNLSHQDSNVDIVLKYNLTVLIS